jgi:Holliday junction resolvase RusA-like endonuclease
VKMFTAPGRRRDGKKNLKHTIGYTTEAEDYMKEFIQWMDEHHAVDVQRFVLGHRPWMVYDLEIRLYFPMWELLNKGWLQKHASDSRPGSKDRHRKGERKAKSPYKRLDTLNRRKLLEDALAESLSIDDSLTWEAHVSKLVVPEEGESRVVLTLSETDARCYGIPSEFLED